MRFPAPDGAQITHAAKAALDIGKESQIEEVFRPAVAEQSDPIDRSVALPGDLIQIMVWVAGRGDAHHAHFGAAIFQGRGKRSDGSGRA